jgi:hypothetical protein
MSILKINKENGFLLFLMVHIIIKKWSFPYINPMYDWKFI